MPDACAPRRALSRSRSFFFSDFFFNVHSLSLITGLISSQESHFSLLFHPQYRSAFREISISISSLPILLSSASWITKHVRLAGAEHAGGDEFVDLGAHGRVAQGLLPRRLRHGVVRAQVLHTER